MAGSRHLFGTVFSRVTGLLESKVLKAPPLWYEIVQAFQPDNPTANSNAPPGRPEVITFPQDVILREARANIEGFNREPLNLFGDGDDSISTRPYSDSIVAEYVKRYETSLNSGMEPDECLSTNSAWFETAIANYRKRKGVSDAEKIHEKVSRKSASDEPEDILSLLTSPSKGMDGEHSKT